MAPQLKDHSDDPRRLPQLQPRIGIACGWGATQSFTLQSQLLGTHHRSLHGRRKYSALHNSSFFSSPACPFRAKGQLLYEAIPEYGLRVACVALLRFAPKGDAPHLDTCFLQLPQRVGINPVIGLQGIMKINDNPFRKQAQWICPSFPPWQSRPLLWAPSPLPLVKAEELSLSDQDLGGPSRVPSGTPSESKA